jgi:hypothetical protein
MANLVFNVMFGFYVRALKQKTRSPMFWCKVPDNYLERILEKKTGYPTHIGLRNAGNSSLKTW